MHKYSFVFYIILISLSLNFTTCKLKSVSKGAAKGTAKTASKSTAKTASKGAAKSAAKSTSLERKAIKNFLTDLAPILKDGRTIRVVIEIASGTLQKWEVDKSDGQLKWQQKNGKGRVVKYLPYPANYGMIPRTLLPKETGGDGDPLDILVLGPSVNRGDILDCKLIGVLHLLDGGEQDDKLVAVMKDSPFYEVNNWVELDAQFKGVKEILQIWFSNYKGAGIMKFQGLGDEKAATNLLHSAMKAFEKEQKQTNTSK